MSDVALYRKYRPQTFQDVLGQEHVVKVLEGSLKKGDFAHAYLFAGTRGTGKTSIARILAREMGCSDKDLYEIDAASNRGIDDVRELREAVHVLPFESPYKVYIIDEVHMLTKEAFNALLKTLEEPPAHTIFVLATTEFDKLPDTIVSRCQTFQFKKPPQNTLKDMITQVAKEEGYTLDSAAADLIALVADGSFRDAHGILQKVFSSTSEKKISNEDIEMIVGAPRAEVVNACISAIDEKDAAKGLHAVQQAVDAGISIKVFIKLVLHKVRMVLLLRYAQDMEEGLKQQVTEEDFAFLKELAQKKDTHINSKTLNTLLDAYNRAGYAYVPQLSIELALIDLCQESDQTKQVIDE